MLESIERCSHGLHGDRGRLEWANEKLRVRVKAGVCPPRVDARIDRAVPEELARLVGEDVGVAEHLQVRSRRVHHVEWPDVLPGNVKVVVEGEAISGPGVDLHQLDVRVSLVLGEDDVVVEALVDQVAERGEHALPGGWRPARGYFGVVDRDVVSGGVVLVGSPKEIVELVAVTVVVPGHVVLQHGIGRGAVEVEAATVCVVRGGHLVDLAELNRHRVGVPGPDADRTTGRVGVRLVATRVCFGVLDRAPLDPAEHDAAAAVLWQTPGAVVVIGNAVTDVDVLVRRAWELVRQDGNALESIVVAHHAGHARLVQAGPPLRVEEDPELLEVVDLDVVDREVRIMDRVRGYWIDGAEDQDSVGGVGLLTTSEDLEIGDLYVAQILDDDARASAGIDDGAAVAVRADFDLAYRAVRAELDGAVVYFSSCQEEPIILGEGLHGDAIESAPGCLLGRAVRSVVAVGTDIVGLASAGAARGPNQHDDAN